MMVSLPTVTKDGFRLEVVAGAGPEVRFSGSGDMEAVADVKRFLKLLHAELSTEKAAEVRVDFAELYFMNSSCLKAFVTWVHDVDTQGRPYAIRFLTNPRLHWQRRSLATLQRLDPKWLSSKKLERRCPAGKPRLLPSSLRGYR